MRLDPDFVQDLIFGPAGSTRFTQDSPVLPDVWHAYGRGPTESVDLLLAPHIQSSAGRVGATVRQRMLDDRTSDKGASGKGASDKDAAAPRAVYNQFHVVVECRFDELVRLILPMTHWWPRHVGNRRKDFLKQLSNQKKRKAFAVVLGDAFHGNYKGTELTPELLWVANIVGALGWAQAHQDAAADGDDVVMGYDGEPQLRRPSFEEIAEHVVKLFKKCLDYEVCLDCCIWSINRNRSVEPCISRSVPSVKADAGRHLFDISCKDVAWAVLDTGIDARHDAFVDLKAWQEAGGDGMDADQKATWEKQRETEWWKTSRVAKTYDFTRIRFLLDPDALHPDNESLPESLRELLKTHGDRLAEDLEDLRLHLLKGRQVDWGLLEPFLQVPHDENYPAPTNGHGTHVGGILGGADPQKVDQGMCPDIRLYDIRVLGDGGDEFALISALQFISWLNGHRDYLVVHGANLSLSIRHEVQSYACGATPVCEEADRLVASGVVVVAAAGNQGHHTFRTLKGRQEGFLTVSITDPGNAERVITVGSTHRFSPHTYGVSYFSSRGPTGDGRSKPDLVAPGEKVRSAELDNEWGRRDGTSMSAPHVSGAAALLMARHTELMGRSRQVKEILCDTATDLGRERYFQGFGMVDVLRALQSV